MSFMNCFVERNCFRMFSFPEKYFRSIDYFHCFTFNFQASKKSRVLHPPLRGIVQLTNSDTLRFRNWSFTYKGGEHSPPDVLATARSATTITFSGKTGT